MTDNQVPAVITRYLQSADGSDFEALAACFTPDGTVVDEEVTYRGRREIVGWRESTGAKWEYTSSVKSIEPLSDHECLAVVHVEGNFPGGVADLRYRFVLEDGLISSLTIVQ
jgi:hypothetical protein